MFVITVKYFLNCILNTLNGYNRYFVQLVWLGNSNIRVCCRSPISARKGLRALILKYLPTKV